VTIDLVIVPDDSKKKIRALLLVQTLRNTLPLSKTTTFTSSKTQNIRRLELTWKNAQIILQIALSSQKLS